MLLLFIFNKVLERRGNSGCRLVFGNAGLGPRWPPCFFLFSHMGFWICNPWQSSWLVSLSILSNFKLRRTNACKSKISREILDCSKPGIVGEQTCLSEHCPGWWPYCHCFFSYILAKCSSLSGQELFIGSTIIYLVFGKLQTEIANRVFREYRKRQKIHLGKPRKKGREELRLCE